MSKDDKLRLASTIINRLQCRDGLGEAAKGKSLEETATVFKIGKKGGDVNKTHRLPKPRAFLTRVKHKWSVSLLSPQTGSYHSASVTMGMGLIRFVYRGLARALAPAPCRRGGNGSYHLGSRTYQHCSADLKRQPTRFYFWHRP